VGKGILSEKVMGLENPDAIYLKRLVEGLLYAKGPIPLGVTQV
jgi:hypothetical protein